MGGVTGGDGALRHAVVACAGGVLHHADAAGAEDGAQAQCAVGGGAGEDDADGAFRLIFRQRAQKAVDRHALATRLFRQVQLQHAIKNAHLAVGRDDINVVGRDGDLILRFRHRHGGAALEDFGKQADVAGIEMRHQYEGHAGIRRAGMKEGIEGFQPAGGSTNTDDGKSRDAAFLAVSHEIGGLEGHVVLETGSWFPQAISTKFC